ncbi:MAG TPA: AMP-binding protein [Steroidobacteraceae bacterium]|nr:AMP-binding protein [Steroidobacteraceae bacterium]
MIGVIDAVSAVDADAYALLDGSGAVRYDELREAVSALGSVIRAAAAERIAVLADNGRAWAAADLALLASDAVCVPMPAFFNDQQIAHVLNDAGIDCVLTDQPERVAALDRHFAQRTISIAGLSLLQRPRPQQVTKLPLHTAKITYTSGSTGTPKGVCLTRASIERVAWSLHESTQSLGIRRHLCLLPLPTLLENIAGLYVPLLSGATCCVPSVSATGVGYGGLDARRLLSCIEHYRPDSLVLVPELLRVLVRAATEGWRPTQPFKFIAVGGARVGGEEVLEAHALGLPVYEGYGLSECASVVCLNTPEATRIGTVGRVLPHACVRVDAHGELHVSGATMSGYLGEDHHANTEIATGDLASIDADGFVTIHGRAKNLIITSLGRNISPEWVESELLQDPVIAQVMVVGEARPSLGALIVSAGSDEQIECAVQRANSRLPNYAQIRDWKRVPQPFSARAGLLTANGRLRRAAIASRYEGALMSPSQDRPTAVDGESMTLYEALIRATAHEREYLLTAPVIQRALSGSITRPLYLAFLTQAYHHVRHTVPLMRTVGSRLPARLAWLREHIEHYIEEEQGHDEWILNDIDAAGGDRTIAAAAAAVAIPTDAMVAYAYDMVTRGNPAGFFGMVHVLEGTSAAVALNAANRIQTTLGLPSHAFTYLRSHGQLDQEHVQHLAGIVNRLDHPQDRESVVRCARAIYWLYGQMFRALEREAALRKTA